MKGKGRINKWKGDKGNRKRMSGQVKCSDGEVEENKLFVLLIVFGPGYYYRLKNRLHEHLECSFSLYNFIYRILIWYEKSKKCIES